MYRFAGYPTTATGSRQIGDWYRNKSTEPDIAYVFPGKSLSVRQLRTLLWVVIWWLLGARFSVNVQINVWTIVIRLMFAFLSLYELYIMLLKQASYFPVLVQAGYAFSHVALSCPGWFSKKLEFAISLLNNNTTRSLRFSLVCVLKRRHPTLLQ